MFRKSAVALVALFGLAAANRNTPKAPKTTTNNNHLTKLTGFEMCARYPQYASPQASQGAFTFPVHGGACPVAAGSAPDGVLSGVCGMNPYGGRQYTYYRASTGGQNNRDNVGPNCNNGGSNCDFPPTGYPQFENTASPYVNFPDIAQGATASAVQTAASDWCRDSSPVKTVGTTVGVPAQTSTCYGTLAVRGTPGPKNKYPGSELDLVWNTTTTYELVGATYTTETQYGLSGSEYAAGTLYYASLWGYTVFTSITCQFAPLAITHTNGVVYGGSGKYEKTPSAIVDPVTLTTTRQTPTPGTVANPYNVYQNADITWQTKVAVSYIKKGGYLDWTLL